MLPMILNNISKEEMEKRIDDLFKKIGLENKKTSFPDELSGGEHQRVAIAIALANNPNVILCDEPTGELDSENKKKILELFEEFQSRYPEKIFIIVTHDASVRKIGDIIYEIRDGLVYKETKQDASKRDEGGLATRIGFDEKLKNLKEKFEKISNEFLDEFRDATENWFLHKSK